MPRENQGLLEVAKLQAAASLPEALLALIGLASSLSFHAINNNRSLTLMGAGRTVLQIDLSVSLYDSHVLDQRETRIWQS